MYDCSTVLSLVACCGFPILLLRAYSLCGVVQPNQECLTPKVGDSAGAPSPRYAIDLFAGLACRQSQMGRLEQTKR